MKSEVIEKVLNAFGFKRLNPVQQLAVRSGLLDGRNLVISAPTASGKTLCAVLAGFNAFLNKKKMLYLCPLVALASEKYNSFSQKYSKLGARVALSVGDLDSADPWLGRYHWLVVSNEKCDSLIRHGAPWLSEVGLVVADEVHLLQDPARGPTLEVLLTRLRKLLPKAQFLALSATIKNAEEIANWLGASVVKSDWRPVRLYEGIAYGSNIKFLEKRGYELDAELPTEEAIVRNTLQLKKQALFFVATRRGAEALAEKLAKVIKPFLGRNERRLLVEVASQVENVLEIPTKQCKRLAKCIRNGSGFHHSGLLFKQRVLVEENFKKGLIKVIVATPSLAYGVNLPSFRVVMRDLKRYYPGIGAVFIPVLEVHQMLGRCGRPSFDSFGEGILLAKNEDEADELKERYILGEAEEIHSRLALEPVLRMHVLASIALDIKTETALLDFFSKTFYAFQYHEIDTLNDLLLAIVDKLVEWEFVVKRARRIDASKLGKRVAELYLDPLTAHRFIQGLTASKNKHLTPLSFLQLISNSLEMRPLVSVKVGEFAELDEKIVKRCDEFLEPIPAEWELSYDDFLRSVKTALMFEGWINEMSEEEILTSYRVTPGELYGKLHDADWLLYALQELALLLGKKDLLKPIRKLRVRIQRGVKEELLPLVKLRLIGRIRARRLYNSGLRSLADLRKVSYESLARLVGPKIAHSIKEELGQVKRKKESKQKTLKRWELLSA